MNLVRVLDLKHNEVMNTQYDIAIFSSGYEQRSPFLAEKLQIKNLKKIIILGFDDSMSNEIRKKNDHFFLEN